MNMGIGSLNDLQKYVGIPFESGGRATYGIDCWGLVCAVYGNELGISLPDWCIDEEVSLDSSGFDVSVIDSPVDFCLVRCKRGGNVPDHFGVYVGGGVLSADRPSSNYVPLDKFLDKYPNTTFIYVSEEAANA